MYIMFHSVRKHIWPQRLDRWRKSY